MTNRNIILWIILISSLFILISFNKCERTERNTDDIKIENKIIEEKITTYRDSIIYIDSIIFTHVSIKDSISKSNKNTLDVYYDGRIDSLNTNKDTLIDNLTYEIEISDTIIDNLTDKTILQDSVIISLEIINHNFEDMLEETEKELVKLNKKNKRKNVFIIIGSTVITILSVILIVT